MAPTSLVLPFARPPLIDAVQSKRFQYEAADRVGEPVWERDPSDGTLRLMEVDARHRIYGVLRGARR